MPDDARVPLPRPRALEAGLFLICVALPLAVVPPAALAFADAKPLVLTAGTLAIWVSGIPVDRRLAVPAATLGAVAVLAAVFGVDPLESLYGSSRPVGLVILVPALSLLVVGAVDPVRPAVPREGVARAHGARRRDDRGDRAPRARDPRPGRRRGPLHRRDVREPRRARGIPRHGVRCRVRGRGPAGPGERVDGPGRVPAPRVRVRGHRRAERVRPAGRGAARRRLVRPARSSAAVDRGGGDPRRPPRVHRHPGDGGRSARSVGLAVLDDDRRGAASRGGHGEPAGWHSSDRSSAGDRRTPGAPSCPPGPPRRSRRRRGHGATRTTCSSTSSSRWACSGSPRSRGSPSGSARGCGERRPDRGWAAAGRAHAARLLDVRAARPDADPVAVPPRGGRGRAVSVAGHSVPSGCGADPRRRSDLLAGRARAVRIAVGGALGRDDRGRRALARVVDPRGWGRTHFGSRWALEDARTLAPWRLTTVEALALELALDARAGDEAAAAQARALIADAVAGASRQPGDPRARRRRRGPARRRGRPRGRGSTATSSGSPATPSASPPTAPWARPTRSSLTSTASAYGGGRTTARDRPPRAPVAAPDGCRRRDLDRRAARDRAHGLVLVRRERGRRTCSARTSSATALAYAVDTFLLLLAVVWRPGRPQSLVAWVVPILLGVALLGGGDRARAGGPRPRRRPARLARGRRRHRDRRPRVPDCSAPVRGLEPAARRRLSLPEPGTRCA